MATIPVLFFLLTPAGPAGAAVMVPLRTALAHEEIMVGWDGAAATAYLPDGRLLRVAPGSEAVELDGLVVLLEAPAVMLAGMLFVPNSLFRGCWDPLPAEESHPLFHLVRAGEQIWFVGQAVDGLDYRLSPPGGVNGGADGALPEPVPGRVWLLPSGGGGDLVDALVSRMDAELRSVTGNVYSLAPGAGEALKGIMAGDAPTELALPIIRRVGFCEVRFDPSGSAYNNMLNAVKATEYLNGTVVAPGQVFSFNAAVGQRTAERGFVVGYAISGNRYVPARGGGVCRTSTVLYGAVLDAGLTVVERHPHSRAVGYVPVGRDATVSYGSADLKFYNSLAHPVRIEAGGTVHRLQVALWEIIP